MLATIIFSWIWRSSSRVGLGIQLGQQDLLDCSPYFSLFLYLLLHIDLQEHPVSVVGVSYVNLGYSYLFFVEA